jgi:hypothetical protein
MVDRNFAEAPLGFATKPHNIDAEQRVLGSLLACNDAFNLIDGIVEAEHFYEPVHRRIFGLMAQEIRAGRVANATTLRTAFRNDQDRFIPAPAGNTAPRPMRTARKTVHPRACGEHASCK